MIAAAGTGGHVFPGLAVAEALVAEGVARSDVICVGGDRVESRVFPENGFEFLQVEVRGLSRSLSPANLTLPLVVARARRAIERRISQAGVGVVLGMGGYVTIPVALAARRSRTPLLIAEQNAEAGLANRIARRWADRIFVSFQDTRGLPGAEWVGNPVRADLAEFDRSALLDEAIAYYGLTPGRPRLGVFGGSLGARAINEAVDQMTSEWSGPPVDVIHLVGKAHEERYRDGLTAGSVRIVRRGFEERMDLFFAVSDLVIARAGGSVAEITATATPSILVPGEFGSTGHQAANAANLEAVGAAEVLEQEGLGRLGALVESILFDSERLSEMADGARRIARPDAAKSIARAMIEATA